MKKFLRNIFKKCLKVFISLLVLSIVWVVVYRWVSVPITPLMVIRSVEQKQKGKVMRCEHEWKLLSEISPHLQLAVVCTEDQNFLKHNGFDFGAIEKAIKHNKESRRKRGASTISQQVAKNVFLWNGRNWFRKGLEVYFTFLIEVCWSKQRIMEVYLNVIEMGDGIYGAEAASQFYFDKSAQELTKLQAAKLAIILPSPLKYNLKRSSSFIKQRTNWTLQQMRYWGGELKYNQNKDKKSFKF